MHTYYAPIMFRAEQDRGDAVSPRALGRALHARWNTTIIIIIVSIIHSYIVYVINTIIAIVIISSTVLLYY